MISRRIKALKAGLEKRRRMRLLKDAAKRGPARIILGASQTSQRGWIPTEIDFLNIVKEADWKACFSCDSVDAIMAEHVWEHLTRDEGVLAARQCFRYLKKGGYVRAAVPDGLHPDPKYIEWVKPGGVGLGAEGHKALYTYKTFKDVFESAGFRAELLEYFDEEGIFHFREWDPDGGLIVRSKRFDDRNSEGKLNYTSIILDARKSC